jgi:hypothetical protein
MLFYLVFLIRKTNQLGVISYQPITASNVSGDKK